MPHHEGVGDVIMPRKRGRKSRSTWGSNDDAGAGRRRLRYWADLHDGRGYTRHSKTIVGTKTDGDEELARLRLGHGRDAPCPTVGQAWEMWVLPEYDRRLAAYLADPTGVPRGKGLKPKSYKAYASLWENHVAPTWSDVALSGVRAIDVQSWLDGLPLSGQTASIALSLLKQALAKGVKYEVIETNVVSATSGWELPASARRGPVDIWTLDELVYGLWPAVWGTVAEGAFILAAFGSCRPGESLGPRVDEVSFDSSGGMTIAMVPVVRQVDETGTETVDGDLKNDWSPRTVAIPEPWSLRLAQLCDDRGARPVWLTERGDGRPFRRDRLGDELHRAERRAGLPSKEPRALRRSWRSWMATESGIPAELLEKMMGHVGEGVTGRHYLSMPPDMVRDVVLRAFTERPISVDWDKLGHRL